MQLQIRRYRAADRSILKGFFDAFQDELVAMDDLGRLWRGPGYAEAAAEQCLRETREQRGQVLIAELDGQPVGFAAGIVGDLAPFDRLTARAGPYGRVTELYVRPAARRQGIATRLLARLDRYFARAGCDAVRIEVFAPNRAARRLYERLGYHERDIDLLRPITSGPAQPQERAGHRPREQPRLGRRHARRLRGIPRHVRRPV
jgi:ribosomal protein S18 acetylase RimI-like enzyme